MLILMEELKQEILRGKQRKREQPYNLAQFSSSSHPSQSMVRSSWKTSKGVPGSLVGNRSLCVFFDSVCSFEDRHCAAGKGELCRCRIRLPWSSVFWWQSSSSPPWPRGSAFPTPSCSCLPAYCPASSPVCQPSTLIQRCSCFSSCHPSFTPRRGSPPGANSVPISVQYCCFRLAWCLPPRWSWLWSHIFWLDSH